MWHFHLEIRIEQNRYKVGRRQKNVSNDPTHEVCTEAGNPTHENSKSGKRKRVIVSGSWTILGQTEELATSVTPQLKHDLQARERDQTGVTVGNFPTLHQSANMRTFVCESLMYLLWLQLPISYRLILNNLTLEYFLEMSFRSYQDDSFYFKQEFYLSSSRYFF